MIICYPGKQGRDGKKCARAWEPCKPVLVCFEVRSKKPNQRHIRISNSKKKFKMGERKEHTFQASGTEQFSVSMFSIPYYWDQIWMQMSCNIDYVLTGWKVGQRGSVVKDTTCYLLPLKGGRGFDPTSWRNLDAKLEVRKSQRRNISLLCEIRHLSNAPIHISGRKQGARRTINN